jgi:hypothetical protein
LCELYYRLAIAGEWLAQYRLLQSLGVTLQDARFASACSLRGELGLHYSDTRSGRAVMDQRLEAVGRQSAMHELGDGAAAGEQRSYGRRWHQLICQFNCALAVLGETLERYRPTQSLGSSVQELRFLVDACG